MTTAVVSPSIRKGKRSTPSLPAKSRAVGAALAKTIGARLRSLRKSQGLRLLELTKTSGVDAATISRIETGRMTGTLESHLKLARALGVKLTELYAGLETSPAKAAVLQTPAGRTDVYVHQTGKSTIAMLTADVLRRKLMPVLITVEPGGTTHEEEARAGTEKFIYVLEGSLEARVGSEAHQLKRGSALYFDASLPHLLRNAGTKAARCIAVSTPPAL